jgi:hypothetical protein
MDEKPPSRGMLLEALDEPGGYAVVSSKAAAGFEAESQEIEFSPKIVIRWEPDVFALECGGHG